MAHGFSPVSEVELAEHRSVLRRYEHEATGLDLVHLAAEGEESTFGFVFRTPALDDRGTSHIVEHSVLCGSRRFPLKDPFVQLLKGSMSTYLNAWTFPDKTVYPAASTVEKEFFNLIRVYGDAVFFPRLLREVFDQEAHRYELDAERGLRIVGVVYNEMRGVYSDPEATVGRWTHRSLFPDTTYGRDSGGDPAAVPLLTYEDFVEYHRRFYHPSNARVFVHGPVAADKVLSLLNEELLAGFDRRPVDSGVAAPAGWTSPRLVEKTFPARASDPTQGRASVVLNWRLAEATDGLLLVAFEVIEELLLGNAGSPLRKALVESRLGEDLSPASGLDTELRWLVFSAGLRGTEAARRQSIEDLILASLRALSSGGIPRDVLEAALQRVEFRNREIRRPGGPPALELMRRALRGWLHGADPQTTLQFDPWIREVRARASEGFLEDLIRSWLLDNPHRSTLVVAPEAGGVEREEQQLASRLQEAARSMGSGERALVRRRAESLAAYQQTPDPPEALSTLPRLELSDLPRAVDRIPQQTDARSGPLLCRHELFTGGVVYVDLAYPLWGLDDVLRPFAPLLARAVTGLGLPGRPYDLVARDLALVSGGFSAHVDAGASVAGEVKGYLVIRLKALRPTLEAALALAASLIERADLLDRSRLADLVREARNRARASVIPEGSRYAALRAGSRVRASLRLEEEWEGISQVLFRLGLDPDGGIDAIGRTLESLRAAVLGGPAAVAMTGEGLAEASRLLPQLGARPDAAGPGAAPSAAPFLESLLIPSSVGYVAQAIDAAPLGSGENAEESVLAHLLSTGHLWEAIRTRGGAYGASASVDGLERLFTFATYRDPNIATTLRAFRDALQRLAGGEASQADVREGIIGCVNRDARPMAPGDKGLIALKRLLFGVGDELRQRRRDALFGVTAAAVAQAAARLLAALARASTVVMSSRQAVEAAAREDAALSGLAERTTEVAI